MQKIYIGRHIYRYYAHILATYMAANDSRLQSSYNYKEPLESLIELLNIYANFAAESGESIM